MVGFLERSKQKLLAVPIDNGCGFCVMKEKTYSDKQNEIPSASLFEARNGENDDLTIKTEKLIHSILNQVIKQGMNKRIDLSKAQDDWITNSQASWTC